MTEDRASSLAIYMLEHNTTVRSAAAHFGISKSTVHKDITQRLCHSNPQLYRQIRILLEANKAERHLRGGEATRRKYRGS